MANFRYVANFRFLTLHANTFKSSESNKEGDRNNRYGDKRKSKPNSFLQFYDPSLTHGGGVGGKSTSILDSLHMVSCYLSIYFKVLNTTDKDIIVGLNLPFIHGMKTLINFSILVQLSPKFNELKILMKVRGQILACGEIFPCRIYITAKNCQ